MSTINPNGSTQGNNTNTNNNTIPIDCGIQDSYRNLSESIQLVGGEINNQQKQNFYLVPNCQAMVEEAGHIQRCYYEVLTEVQEIRNAIRAADAKLSYVSRRIHEFVPIEDLVVHHDGYTYSRNALPSDAKTTSTSSGSAADGEGGGSEGPIPNRTLIMMLEKLAGLFPPSERGSPYSNLPMGDDLYSYTGGMGAMVGGGIRRPQQQGDHTSLYNSYNPSLGMRSASSTQQQQQPPLSQQPPLQQQPLTAQQQPTSMLSSQHAHAPHQSGGGMSYHRETTEKFHPCLRVYGTCNYGRNCAYAKYPYDACLSNLKGRCRFGNQCHERHVDFLGPLDDEGMPVTNHADGGG